MRKLRDERQIQRVGVKRFPSGPKRCIPRTMLLAQQNKTKIRFFYSTSFLLTLHPNIVSCEAACVVIVVLFSYRQPLGSAPFLKGLNYHI